MNPVRKNTSSMSASPYLAILSTGTAIAERIARAEGVWTLHLSTSDDLDLGAANSPVTFLRSDQRLQLRPSAPRRQPGAGTSMTTPTTPETSASGQPPMYVTHEEATDKPLQSALA